MPAINKLILGTVQFGLKYGINNTSSKPSQEEVNDILLYAFEAGVSCLDTAEAYGDAHQVIGKFHKLNPNKSFDIITKLPHDLKGDIFTKVRKYIADLKVSYLKALLFHSFDTYIQNQSVVDELGELKRKDIVELSGVSVYTNEQAEIVIEDERINIIQIPFNLFDNENKRGSLLRKAKEKGKIVHTRSAFLQGLFFIKKNDPREIVTLLEKDLNLVRGISERSGITIQQLALNYCLQQDYIDQTLIGIDNKEQLIHNITDSVLHVSSDLIDEINLIDIQDTNLLNPSLWKR